MKADFQVALQSWSAMSYSQRYPYKLYLMKKEWDIYVQSQFVHGFMIYSTETREDIVKHFFI